MCAVLSPSRHQTRAAVGPLLPPRCSTLSLPSCVFSQGFALAGSNSPVNGASLRRARSAEAESPPTTQLYALRSRAAAPHRSPPGFGASPDPEAAAAADHAASTTMGPIKSRLKVRTPHLKRFSHAHLIAIAGGPSLQLSASADTQSILSDMLHAAPCCPMAQRRLPSCHFSKAIAFY